MTRQDDQPEQIQFTASKDREQQIGALDESDIAALVSFLNCSTMGTASEINAKDM